MTKRQNSFRAAVFLSLLGSITAASAEEPLLRYLPGDSTNALAVVRVDQIRGPAGSAGVGSTLSTPGAEAIPAWIDRLVVGAQVRLGARERVRTIAVAELETGTAPGQVLSARGEAAERFGVYTASPTAKGDYIVVLAARVAALVRPGVRQEVSRWIGSLSSGPPKLAPYLREAADRPEEVVLALDLRDALSADRAKRWLEAQDAAELRDANAGQLASLLAKLVGVSLAVDLGQETKATIRVRFEGPVSAKAETLRTAFDQLVGESQVSFPELEAAAVSVEGSEFVLRMNLTEDSLRRVFSLIVVPPPPAASEPEPAEPRTADAEPSQKYFRSVENIVRDLERASRRASDYGRTAAWHDNFAQKIEDLPTDAVDPELVEFGQRTASRFRALAASLRGQAVEVNAEQRSVTYDVKVDPGFVGVNVWGGVGYSPSTWHSSSNLREVRERQATAIAAGAKARQEIWQLIADDRAAVAQQMADKFGVPFGGTRR